MPLWIVSKFKCPKCGGRILIRIEDMKPVYLTDDKILAECEDCDEISSIKIKRKGSEDGRIN